MFSVQLEHVRLDIADGVGVLTLDHQEVMNAISSPMLASLIEALEIIDERRDEVRCLLFTGAGRAFCAGANLQGRRAPRTAAAAGATLETEYHPFLRRMRNVHCPVVTAVNGPAAGGGMAFALMGDIVLCARSTYFLQAFRRIGLVPDCGSSALLPRLIGKARSVELSLLGEKLPAETALKWGLINRVCDDASLMTEAMAMARDLAAGPTVALSLIRKLYWDTFDNSFDDQLDQEQRAQRVAGGTDDFREGVAAFLDKRPARFEGR